MHSGGWKTQVPTSSASTACAARPRCCRSSRRSGRQSRATSPRCPSRIARTSGNRRSSHCGIPRPFRARCRSRRRSIRSPAIATRSRSSRAQRSRRASATWGSVAAALRTSSGAWPRRSGAHLRQADTRLTCPSTPSSEPTRASRRRIWPSQKSSDDRCDPRPRALDSLEMGAEGKRPESSAAEIVFRGVTKRYPGRSAAAVDNLSLRIPAGEICVLVGPSGGGKTTAMKMVNRLIEITEGDILMDGRSVRSLEVLELRRRIGYVIQHVGLFPHMSVAANIATVPRLLGWSKTRTQARVRELLELVGLDSVHDPDRYPRQLLGGQQQIVGLARAMDADPDVMLMDEPFGALDPITRERLQQEFLRLHAEIRKTVIFVTHDIDEAIKMGDRIAILREGGILAQYDTPDAILANPADEFVARFVGEDRSLKRLALKRLSDIELLAVPNGHDYLYPTVAASTTLRDALALMLEEGRRELAVVDEGRVSGLCSVEHLAALLAPEEQQEE